MRRGRKRILQKLYELFGSDSEMEELSQNHRDLTTKKKPEPVTNRSMPILDMTPPPETPVFEDSSAKIQGIHHQETTRSPGPKVPKTTQFQDDDDVLLLCEEGDELGRPPTPKVYRKLFLPGRGRTNPKNSGSGHRRRRRRRGSQKKKHNIIINTHSPLYVSWK